jgi:hypothetical protein
VTDVLVVVLSLGAASVAWVACSRAVWAHRRASYYAGLMERHVREQRAMAAAINAAAAKQRLGLN